MTVFGSHRIQHQAVGDRAFKRASSSRSKIVEVTLLTLHPIALGVSAKGSARRGQREGVSAEGSARRVEGWGVSRGRRQRSQVSAKGSARRGQRGGVSAEGSARRVEGGQQREETALTGQRAGSAIKSSRERGVMRTTPNYTGYCGHLCGLHLITLATVDT